MQPLKQMQLLEILGHEWKTNCNSQMTPSLEGPQAAACSCECLLQFNPSKLVRRLCLTIAVAATTQQGMQIKDVKSEHPGFPGEGYPSSVAEGKATLSIALIQHQQLLSCADPLIHQMNH